MTSIPSPAPNTVGQLVPEFGRDGCVGVGAEAPAHVQSVSATHEAFRQNPW